MELNLTPEMVAEIINRLTLKDRAQMAHLNSNPYPSVLRQRIDLSVARDRKNPLRIDFPFKVIRTAEATCATSQVFVRPDSSAEFQGEGFLLTGGEYFRDGQTHTVAFLHWSAQADQFLTLEFYRFGEIVSPLSDPSFPRTGIETLDTDTPGALSAAGTTQILPGDATRKRAVIQNQHASAYIYLGDNGCEVTGNDKAGIRIGPDESYVHEGSVALFARSSAAVAVGEYAILIYR